MVRWSRVTLAIDAPDLAFGVDLIGVEAGRRTPRRNCGEGTFMGWLGAALRELGSLFVDGKRR